MLRRGFLFSPSGEAAVDAESGLILDLPAQPCTGYGQKLIAKTLASAPGVKTSFRLTRTGMVSAFDLPLTLGGKS